MKGMRIFLCSSFVVVLGYLVVAVCLNRTVTVITENKTISSAQKIIIDAGHGGEDGGATSYSGVLESHLNLEIAQRLKDLLNFLGHQTIMVREDDSAVHTEGKTIAQRKISDLKNRVQLVNNTEAALLISIHQNYYTDDRYFGAQVFYADTDASRQLAQQLQRTFRETINPGSNRMAQKAENIYLMDQIRCDGVLIECGFISNYQEEQSLRNSEYQKKLCSVIASEVSIYLHTLAVPA